MHLSGWIFYRSGSIGKTFKTPEWAKEPTNWNLNYPFNLISRFYTIKRSNQGKIKFTTRKKKSISLLYLSLSGLQISSMEQSQQFWNYPFNLISRFYIIKLLNKEKIYFNTIFIQAKTTIFIWIADSVHPTDMEESQQFWNYPFNLISRFYTIKLSNKKKSSSILYLSRLKWQSLTRLDYRFHPFNEYGAKSTVFEVSF
jgi:hypothetical protein